VAVAPNEALALLMEGLLQDRGVPSLIQRAPGFDVPDFLSAGPRDVLVRERIWKKPGRSSKTPRGSGRTCRSGVRPLGMCFLPHGRRHPTTSGVPLTSKPIRGGSTSVMSERCSTRNRSSL
jgi:hypothetical protein